MPSMDKRYSAKLMIMIQFFNDSLQGELWGWTCFYIGVAAVGFGSAYYHLQPNDSTLVWDRLPVSLTCN